MPPPRKPNSSAGHRCGMSCRRRARRRALLDDDRHPWAAFARSRQQRQRRTGCLRERAGFLDERSRSAAMARVAVASASVLRPARHCHALAHEAMISGNVPLGSPRIATARRIILPSSQGSHRRWMSLIVADRVDGGRQRTA